MAVKKKSLNEFKNELALYMPESEVAAVTHIVDSGKGSFYQDITGKQYLDFSSGIFTNNFGHGDAEITNTFSEIFGSLGNIHGRQWKGTLEVCRKLFKLLPSQNYQVIFYGDGGGYIYRNYFIILESRNIIWLLLQEVFTAKLLAIN